MKIPSSRRTPSWRLEREEVDNVMKKSFRLEDIVMIIGFNWIQRILGVLEGVKG